MTTDEQRARLRLGVGLLAAAGMGIFAFFPSAGTAVLLGAALVAGVVLPEAALFSIIIAIGAFPLISASGPVSDFRVDELMILALLLGVAIRMLPRREVPRTELTIPFAAFLAVALISMGLRIAIGAEISPRSFLAPMAKQVLRLALFLAVVWMVTKGRTTVSRMRLAIVASMNVGAAFGLAQVAFDRVTEFIVYYYMSLHGTAPKVFWGDRAYGAFDGNPNHFGMAMLFAAVLALSRAFEVDDKKGRTWWFLASLMPLFAIVASGSRADWAISLVILAIMAWKKRGVWFGGVAAFIAYTLIVPNAFTWRLKKLLLVNDAGQVVPGTSLEGKIESAAGGGFAKSMIVTDNFYLDILYNYWPVALALFIWFLYRGVKALWLPHKQTDRVDAIVTASLLVWVTMIVASVQGPFFGTARVVELFWIISGLTWGYFALHKAPECEADPSAT